MNYRTAAGIQSINNAAEALGIGSQYASMHPRDIADPAEALQFEAEVLAQYSILPAQFSFDTFKPGLLPGLLLNVAIDFPLFSAGLLDGDWLVQEVNGNWIAGNETASDQSYHHFRYTITVINCTEISNTVDLLRKVSAVSGTDLTVDGSDNTVVTSATYTFVSGDIGSRINIGSATGWTPGEYLITGVTAGAATLNMTPAAVSTTGGIWSLFNGTAYQSTWTAQTSDWTHNQIIILVLITATDGVSHVLMPFKYAEQGFVIVGPPDPTTGPDYEVTGNTVTLKAATSAGDILLAVYFPEGVPGTTNVNPHGDDLQARASFGDFGLWVSSDSFCFDSSAVGKIMRITGNENWTPGDYLVITVGTDSMACWAALEFSPFVGPDPTGGIWELIS